MIFFSLIRDLSSFKPKNAETRYAYQFTSTRKNAIRQSIYMDSGLREQPIFTNSIQIFKNSENQLFKHLNRAGISFLKTTPFPFQREESYKFVPLDRLFGMNLFTDSQKNTVHSPKFFADKEQIEIHFLNGFCLENFSSTNYQSSKHLYLGSFEALPSEKKKYLLDISNQGESSVTGGFFSALNTACLSQISVLLIPENYNCEKEINLFFQQNDYCSKFYLNQKLIIISGRNSNSKISQYHFSFSKLTYFDNTNVNIVLKDYSVMKYYVTAKNNQLSSQIFSLYVDVKKNVSFDLSIASSNSFISRVNVGIDMNGVNSDICIKSISIVNDEGMTDFHSRITHNYPQCVSSQLHKNLVEKNGHGIFSGKIQVHGTAFNSEACQLCKSLLLSKKSKVDIMPILEINNDNVKCTHGSTIADLDKNQIFYLQSRGISLETSYKMLVNSFIRDVIDSFPDFSKKILL